jgi:hypothetical protein
MFILRSLLTLPLLFKIHQLNKLLNNVLLHMFILWSLLTPPLLFKIHQLNKLLSNVLLHLFILWSFSHYPSSSKSTNRISSSAAFSNMFILRSLLLILPLLLKI